MDAGITVFICLVLSAGRYFYRHYALARNAQCNDNIRRLILRLNISTNSVAGQHWLVAHLFIVYGYSRCHLVPLLPPYQTNNQFSLAMQISNNVSLRERNSFGFDISAEYFCSAASIEDVHEALEWQQNQKCPLFILGGGSNTVFTRNVEGLVLHVAIDELTTDTTETSVTVNAGAGINWHSLVKSTVFNGHFGLENLALIPGNAGAAPIQNIGAYGKEICDNLISVDAIHRQTCESVTLKKSDCDFGYRHSLFKTPAGADFIVLGIRIRLSTDDNPVVSYQALADAIDGTNAKETTNAESVFNHVCRLRQSKLPDPSVIGNAGSFFKNPVVQRRQVDALRSTYPDLPVYPQPGGKCKLPAAWLIDQAGWKGHRQGEVGVHDRQALVLVNHGGGCGQQIATLADEIHTDIKNRYDIDLEREPVIY